MKAYQTYVDYLKALLAETRESITEPRARVKAALDGQPARELRRLINLEELRAAGAFFTGRQLARRALSSFLRTIKEDSIILDPACGAGDLLLACASRLSKAKDKTEKLRAWETGLMGRDIHSEFIQAAKIRLLLACLYESRKSDDLSISNLEDIFSKLETRCGLTDVEAIRTATHIALNPPYSLVDAPEDCSWAKGRVSSAAIFLESCVVHARPGTRVAAILPDVLRSGSRYQKWRDLVLRRANVNSIKQYGLFDSWADVDVFLLDLTVRATCRNLKTREWAVPKSRVKQSVKDHFNVCVGQVVAYRDPHEGPWVPFLCSRGMPTWGEIDNFSTKRRFSGKVVCPPFVAIRRTSRPGDKHRAAATIVIGSEPVALENHLIALLPKDGSLDTCRAVIKILQRAETNQWLNHRISCRHLTVSAMADLPWWGDI